MSDLIANENPSIEPSQPKAQLVSLRMINYRLFRDEMLVFDPKITVLVGRNDTGKSTALSALELYGEITQETGFRKAIDVSDIGLDKNVPITFEALWIHQNKEWRHRIIIDSREPREELYCEDRQWIWNAKKRKLIINFSDRLEYDASDLDRLLSLAKIGDKNWAAETDVPAEIYEPLHVLDAFRTPTPFLFQSAALAVAAPVNKEPDISGFGWAVWLQELINRRDTSMDTIESRLRKLFPFFCRAKVREERISVSRTERVIGREDEDDLISRELRKQQNLHFEKEAEIIEKASSKREVLITIDTVADEGGSKKAQVPARNVSSGLLLALAHIVLVYVSPTGSLLALEEPENGLNGEITFKVIQLLRDVVEERKQQLILTTHSGFWLDAVPLEGVRVFTRNQRGAHITAVEPNALRQVLQREGVFASEVFHSFGPEGLLNIRTS